MAATALFAVTMSSSSEPRDGFLCLSIVNAPAAHTSIKITNAEIQPNRVKRRLDMPALWLSALFAIASPRLSAFLCLVAVVGFAEILRRLCRVADALVDVFGSLSILAAHYY